MDLAQNPINSNPYNNLACLDNLVSTGEAGIFESHIDLCLFRRNPNEFDSRFACRDIFPSIINLEIPSPLGRGVRFPSTAVRF